MSRLIYGGLHALLLNRLFHKHAKMILWRISMVTIMSLRILAAAWRQISLRFEGKIAGGDQQTDQDRLTEVFVFARTNVEKVAWCL